MTAWAANWKWITSTDKVGVYYDQNSVSMRYSTVDAWLKWYYPYPKNNVSYQITHVYYNLGNKTTRLVSLTDYEQNGNVIDSHSFDIYQSEYESVIPDSIGWAIMEALAYHFGYRL